MTFIPQKRWWLAAFYKLLQYSRTLIIGTPVRHFYVKSAQINEFVRMSELSDQIHYLAS